MTTTRTQGSASIVGALPTGWLPIIVLAASLAMTGIAWNLTRAGAENSARAQFESAATHITQMTHRRMLMQEELLRGAVALFTSSSTVSREEWHGYVDKLELRERFPGTQAMGYAIRLQSAELAGHAEATRREGFPTYNVWPAGQRDEYTVDSYVEPAGPNLRAIGYDMFSEPDLRAAMEEARDSGKVTLTSRSTLFQASGPRPGPGPHLNLLMYAPVYRTGATPATLAERRIALRGYVFAAFDAGEIVRSVLGDWPGDISCEIQDDEQALPGARGAARVPATAQADRAEVAAFTTTRRSEIAGHPWILRCGSAPYAQAINTSRPLVVLAAGIPISFLFFAIAWSQSTLRERAQALANEMTATLRQNEAEKQRLEASLRQAHKLEAMGTLAGGIAHDFNNILGAILGYGELAQNAAPAQGPMRRYLDNIMSAGLRAKSLVERILAFSRSGLGEKIPVHAQSVVTEVLDLISGSLPPGVRLQRELHAGDAAVVGDPTQIHQVLMNLCTNALQAMKSGGVLTVSLDLLTLQEPRALATAPLPPGEYVRLLVRDSGIGIPPELLERIFDPFFTTKEVGVGTGLGLSLVHGIVSDLGGAVDVQSEPGRGSTFTVLLPSHGRASHNSLAAEEPPRGAGETILLVDDEEPLVCVGEEMIAELGYEPIGFTSSTAALAAFRADPRRFAAVISDETMPEMTGSQLAHEIRKLRADIPIVLMSGHGGTSLAARAMAAGANEVLGKPLVARDIARSLAAVLNKSSPS